MHITKPPLGITPRYIVLEKRKNEILAGIGRYREARKKVPVYWILELNDLVAEIPKAIEEFYKQIN